MIAKHTQINVAITVFQSYSNFFTGFLKRQVETKAIKTKHSETDQRFIPLASLENVSDYDCDMFRYRNLKKYSATNFLFLVKFHRGCSQRDCDAALFYLEIPMNRRAKTRQGAPAVPARSVRHQEMNLTVHECWRTRVRALMVCIGASESGLSRRFIGISRF